MGIILTWIAGALIVGLLGRKHQGGFWAFFIGSLILSPAIGILVIAGFELVSLINEKKASK